MMSLQGRGAAEQGELQRSRGAVQQMQGELQGRVLWGGWRVWLGPGRQGEGLEQGEGLVGPGQTVNGFGAAAST